PSPQTPQDAGRPPCRDPGSRGRDREIVLMKLSPLLTMLSLFAVAFSLASSAFAEDAERPVLLVANPLGVPLGATTKIKLRGQKLDNAKEVNCADGKATAKIIGQGGAG